MYLLIRTNPDAVSGEQKSHIMQMNQVTDTLLSRCSMGLIQIIDIGDPSRPVIWGKKGWEEVAEKVKAPNHI